MGCPEPKHQFCISLSVTFFLFFSVFPCTEVLEALMRPSQEAFSQLSLEPLGPLLSILGTLGQEVTVVIIIAEEIFSPEP